MALRIDWDEEARAELMRLPIPERRADRNGFDRAVRRAEERLKEIEG